MNEPKRRGRPPKARIEGADVIDLPVVSSKEQIEAIQREAIAMAGGLSGMSAKLDEIESKAQAYALRVWNGQSVNLSRAERFKRVMAALNGQNLPTEGVELP